jgi:hypothetical protein
MGGYVETWLSIFWHLQQAEFESSIVKHSKLLQNYKNSTLLL